MQTPIQIRFARAPLILQAPGKCEIGFPKAIQTGVRRNGSQRLVE